ncbi:MAG: DUF5615 family PIN-like protein [Candidatus Omnitrophica bacterium]|nr:DUF5615 family PIN-like protein [Candidatus Omnitrophota bacterium]
MKFLIDENIPKKLLKALVSSDHDAVRVETSTRDAEIFERAKRENRILVTLDNDFIQLARFSSIHENFSIILVHIHPPYAGPITEAFTKLLKSVSEEKLKGLIILERSGHIRVI